MSESPIETRGTGSAPHHRLVSVREAARLLACSDMTIRRRIEQRQFPAVTIGSKAMVPRSFVEQLLARAEAGETVVVEELAAEVMSCTAAVAVAS